MVSITAADVRDKLTVDEAAYPDSNLEDEISAAEAFVERRLGGYITEEPLLEQITILVAADFVYPRVTGAAEGKPVSELTQGSRSVSFAVSSAADAIGNSPHWQQALRLDYTGRLDGDNEFWSVTR